MAIEDTMAQMAHSQITQSLPSMTEDIQGFQIIDTNDEINSAIGVIVGLVGNAVVYIPAIYRRGKIYNMDIMYIPELRQWLPTHDNWLTYIRSRKADLEAVVKDRDLVTRGGSASSIELDEPLIQIVKTASEHLDAGYIKRVGIRQALKDAESTIVDQLTTPISSLSGIPSVPALLHKCAASHAARNFIQALSEHEIIGDALVQFYSDDELANASEVVVRAFTVEPRVNNRSRQGTVKLLTSSSVEARDLSDEDKALILRDGAIISDTRGLTPTKVYKTRSNGHWVSPGSSGLYELLKVDGRTLTAFVVCGSRTQRIGSDEVSGFNYVIPMDDGKARVAHRVPAQVLGQPIPIVDINLSGGKAISDIPPNRYIHQLFVDCNGSAFELTASGAQHIGDRGDYVVKLDHGRAAACAQGGSEIDQKSAQISMLVEIPESGKLRIHGKTLYVPKSAKLFDIVDDYAADNRLNLATFDEYLDAVQRRNKLIAVKVYNDPTGYIITTDSDDTEAPINPLSKTAAAVRLVTDYAILPSDAFNLLNEIRPNTATRYLLKIAADANYEMTFSNLQPTEIDRVSIDMSNDPVRDKQSRDEIAAELDAAGKTGVKEIMDVTVLRMLADDGSCVRAVQDMIPSLFSAMNTIGKLLFMLRAGTSMADTYGDLRSDEMEKQFTSLMQRLGDAVIVLQQGKVGSIKDLLEGPLSSTLG